MAVAEKIVNSGLTTTRYSLKLDPEAWCGRGIEPHDGIIRQPIPDRLRLPISPRPHWWRWRDSNPRRGRWEPFRHTKSPPFTPTQGWEMFGKNLAQPCALIYSDCSTLAFAASTCAMPLKNAAMRSACHVANSLMLTFTAMLN